MRRYATVGKCVVNLFVKVILVTWSSRQEFVQPVRHIISTSFLTAKFLRQIEAFLGKGEFSSTSGSNIISNDVQGRRKNPSVGGGRWKAEFT